ncbi:MAG: ABC transporter ATP-binding protein [Gammaproteobacteria bacterium]
MIKLTNVRKCYFSGDIETIALRDVNLQIDAGEFVAIMGPSGCGKSTLMNVLGMIDSPTRGSYEFDGVDVTTFSESKLVKLRKSSLGFIFQSFNLIEDMSVEENITLPLQYMRVPKEERISRVREALELVGLSHRSSHSVTQLSGGQQQRVAVARAIIADPKLVLADEPTGNLDSRNGEEVMELLELLNQQGTTVAMVTHSEKDAQKAHRIISVLDGQIVSGAG